MEEYLINHAEAENNCDRFADPKTVKIQLATVVQKVNAQVRYETEQGIAGKDREVPPGLLAQQYQRKHTLEYHPGHPENADELFKVNVSEFPSHFSPIRGYFPRGPETTKFHRFSDPAYVTSGTKALDTRGRLRHRHG